MCLENKQKLFSVIERLVLINIRFEFLNFVHMIFFCLPYDIKTYSQGSKIEIESWLSEDIFLVALILIPYKMRFVLSSQNEIFFGKGRAQNKSSKNFYG